MLFKKSFSKNLILSFAALFSVVFIFTAFYASRAVEKEALSKLRESLILQARLISHILTPEIVLQGDRPQIHKIVSGLGKETGARVTVIALDGLVLGDSERSWDEMLAMDNHASRPEVIAAMRNTLGTSIRFSHTVKTDMLYAALLLKQGDSKAGVLRVAWPLSDVRRVLDSAAKPIFLSAVLGIAFMAILSFVLGNSLTRDVKRLTEAAAQYTRGDLVREITIQSDNELKLLAGAMNQMASSLKERIAELEAEKIKFSAVLENMKEGVIAVDCENRIQIINQGAQKMFGIQADVTGKPFIEVIRNKALDDMLASAIREQSAAAQEVKISQPLEKILKASAAGISKCEGNVCGLLVLFDMTDIKRLENMRKEFVANVSHELKTPLTSIQGFIETLREGALADTQKSGEFLAMMQEDSERLTRLIHDLLELSRIESQEIPLRARDLDLKTQADKAAAALAGQASARSITVENRIPAGCRVWADPDRLRQIFLNLMDNAVKFNKPGGSIVLSAVPESPGVRVSVEDSGTGIPEKAIPRVFERFFRVDKARSRELGGTGLGLSIVKHLVEAHGGTVSCRSQYGQGSVFSFTLPLPI